LAHSPRREEITLSDLSFGETPPEHKLPPLKVVVFRKLSCSWRSPCLVPRVFTLVGSGTHPRVKKMNPPFVHLSFDAFASLATVTPSCISVPGMLRKYQSTDAVSAHSFTIGKAHSYFCTRVPLVGKDCFPRTDVQHRVFFSDDGCR